LLTIIAGAGAHAGQDADTVLRVFAQRVDAYAQLHRRLETLIFPIDIAGDPHTVVYGPTQLAAAIRISREGARQGDILSAGVAAVLRQRLAAAVAPQDLDAMTADLITRYPSTNGHRVRVHGAYPSFACSTAPERILHALPPLPTELEYRLVDHDLVLLDVHANYIVDVLPDAFRSPIR
jgi:hypothetical protein